MKFNWIKKGFSFDIENHKNKWQSSHAMMPVVLVENDYLRVYYTTRHIDGRSRICYYDTDKNNPSKILYIHNEPILEVGPIGSFDDCGTVATFVLRHEEKIYLYYNGYNVRNTVPWSNSIGLAISNDNGITFQKAFDGPILDRFKKDMYFVISPAIIIENNKWHMWYTSGTGWVQIDDRKEPVYDIKYAFSYNGIDWERDFDIAIPQIDKEECTARPTILKIQNNLYMWFIYRGSRDFRDGNDSYKIGFAEGNIQEPCIWTRNDDKAGINYGKQDFDDKMQAYPCVIVSNEKLFMFYNGNSFGKEGILYAELNKTYDK